MEMRKFIIERHPDGQMTWCEYEDPRDYDKKKSVYNTALRDVINRLNVEHANYMTKFFITDSDKDRADYLKSAGTCKRLVHIIENMAK
jgi:hypothetical protein